MENTKQIVDAAMRSGATLAGLRDSNALQYLELGGLY